MMENQDENESENTEKLMGDNEDSPMDLPAPSPAPLQPRPPLFHRPPLMRAPPPRGPPPGGMGTNGPRGPPPRFPGGPRGPPAGHRPPLLGDARPPGNPAMVRPQGGPPGGGHKPSLKEILGLTPNEELWVETKTGEGKSYFYNAMTRQTVWNRPTGPNIRIKEQSDIEKEVSKAQHQMPPMGQQPVRPMQGGPMGGFPFPPPGQMAAGGFAFPPPFMSGMPPPNFMGGAGGGGRMPMPSGAGPPVPRLSDPAAVWSEFTAPDGRKYYYNATTAETTWDKPQVLKDRDAKQAAESGSAMANGAPGGAGIAAAQDAASTEEMSAAEKGRPISSNPVAGTPWCVVWTGDHRVFFFNPSTRTSVWERPPDLYGRPDVDLLVSKVPETKKPEQKQQPPMYNPPIVAAVASPAQSMDDAGDSDSAPGTPGTPDAPEEPPKKRKKRSQKKPSPPPAVYEPSKETPAKTPDAAMEAEIRAARERAQVPLEIRISRFKEMLTEKEVSAFSTWEKELHKIVFDPRYLLLSSKERKSVFDDYVKERAEVERIERKKKSKEAKENFKKLLLESNLHGRSSFSDFASRHGKDEKFKGIEKMRERETLFTDYVSDLRKREKQEKALTREKNKSDFLALLKEQTKLTRHARWSEVKKTVDSDPRYEKVGSSTLREDWFKEYARHLPSETNSDDEEEDARKERLAQKKQTTKEEAAQRARQKEVAAELADQMKERDKEMEKHKYQEAEDHFKALLADLVRTTDQSWKDTRRQLRKDHRWELADLMDKDQKERLYSDHVKQLGKRRRELFYTVLDETEGVKLTSGWKEVKRKLRDDARIIKLGGLDKRMERDFRDYLAEKLQTAKNDFRELLKETKIITHKSKTLIHENEQHLKDIVSVLENDKRYLVLDCVPHEREKLLDLHLDDLDRRGPPPPPTATEPSRRGK